MNAHGNKRRKLNYDKCDFCRSNKKRCDPPDRIWPQKCERCERMGLDCSENKNLRATKPSADIADRAGIGKTGDRPSEESQRLSQCRDIELELTWLRRCEDYVARINLTTLNKSKSFEAIHGIHEYESMIQERKGEILHEVSKLLHCPSTPVRKAALSVVSSVISRRPADYMEYYVVAIEKDFRALLKNSQASDRIDIELSIRECLIYEVDDQKNTHQMIDDIRGYIGACDRYLERIRQVVFDTYLRPEEDEFPFNGDSRISSKLLRYSSEISFQAKDVFGCNILASAILIAKETDIERLIHNMDKARFLDLAKGDGEDEYNHTILHSAAVRGLMSVFDKVRVLDPGDTISMIDSQDWGQRTPLIIAASQGNCTVVKTLLELGANPEIGDRAEQNALHHAVENGHVQIVEWLIDEQGVCNIDAVNDGGGTALALAVRNGHLDIVKFLLSRGANAGIADNEGETPCDLAEYHDYPEIVAVLEEFLALAVDQ